VVLLAARRSVIFGPARVSSATGLGAVARRTALQGRLMTHRAYRAVSVQWALGVFSPISAVFEDPNSSTASRISSKWYALPMSLAFFVIA
jgi:hypothetical protein